MRRGSVSRRRWLFGVGFAAFTAFPALALAQLPPVPTTPSATVPAVTTPAVTTPEATVPAVTVAPPPAQPNPTPVNPPASGGGGPGSGGSGSTPGSGSGSGGGGGGSAPAPSAGSSAPTRAGRGYVAPPRAAARARVARLRTPRPWISYDGRLKRKTTTLAVWLARSGRVELVVHELAPQCRRAGKIVVRGGSGLNRIPFRGRVGGRRLDPGTYRISARGGAMKVRVVIVAEGRPGTSLDDALAANTCGAGTAASTASGAAIAGALELAGGDIRANGGKRGSDGAGGAPAASREAAKATDSLADDGAAKVARSAVLGAAFTDDESVSTWVRTLLVLLAGGSMILLALAAAPPASLRGSRVGVLAASRRLELTLAGVAILLVAAVSYLYVLTQ